MNKVGIKPDNLKKIAARIVRHAPDSPASPTPPDPIHRLVEAFMEYDCEPARGQAAAAKLIGAMVDFNDLRVASTLETISIIGSQYLFPDLLFIALRRTLQSIFDREHQMSLECLRHMKKAEIRKYLQTLFGINPYVEAVVAMDAFDVHAVPVDTKLLLWMITKEAAGPETTVIDLQQALERILRGDEMADFYRGTRREIEDFTPRVWPTPAKLVPPTAAAVPQAAPAAAKKGPVADPPKPAAKAPDKHPDKHQEKSASRHTGDKPAVKTQEKHKETARHKAKK